jgi:hypothetical protein
VSRRLKAAISHEEVHARFLTAHVQAATTAPDPLDRLEAIANLADAAWGYTPGDPGYALSLLVRARTEQGMLLERWAEEVAAAAAPSAEIRAQALALADRIVARRRAWQEVMGR